MELQYTYWQSGAFFVGFLNDYPEDSTQGVSLSELEEALIEIYEVKQEEKEHLATTRKIGRINNLALKGEVCCFFIGICIRGLIPFLSALKFARKSVQKVLNPSARIKLPA